MRSLAERLRAEGWEGTFIPYLPEMAIPEGEKGVDWNDVMNTLGKSGFPSIDLSCSDLPMKREAT